MWGTIVDFFFILIKVPPTQNSNSILFVCSSCQFPLILFYSHIAFFITSRWVGVKRANLFCTGVASPCYSLVADVHQLGSLRKGGKSFLDLSRPVVCGGPCKVGQFGAVVTVLNSRSLFLRNVCLRRTSGATILNSTVSQGRS